MDDFLKVTVAVIIALILFLILNKYGKDFSVLITIGACAIIFIGLISVLEPVIAFVNELVQIGNLDSDVLEILFKSVGIGLLSEITGIICTDAGNAALGKGLQILAAFTILLLSIPLFTALINLVEGILVAL